MVILRIERYQMMRAVDDPNYVLVDLQCETTGEAERLLAAMRQIWQRVRATSSSNRPRSPISSTNSSPVLAKAAAATSGLLQRVGSNSP